MSAAASNLSVQDIQTWLTNHIAHVMKIDATTINPKMDFEDMGLDSITTVQITESLGNWIGIAIDPTLLYDNSSIEAVSLALVQSTQTNH